MGERIFLLAGEKSGDLIGGRLYKNLKEQLPKSFIFGVGGQTLREHGMECMLRTEDFEVMGYSEVIRSFFKLRKQFYLVRNKILETKPSIVILIDYPGFNLRLASALRDRGYKGKIVQYVSPTVWAWGKGRIEKMVNTLDLLMTIYPFEPTYFSETPLQVKYVGSPIQEVIRNHEYDDNWHRLFGIPSTKNLVALFPGSRKSEIELNLPYQLKAAVKLKKEFPDTLFALSCAHDQVMPTLNNLIRDIPLTLNQDIFFLPKTYSYELMRDCRVALAKSGTVTLELALHKCPTVVMYKLTKLNRLIAQYVMRLNLPHYCIVNILSGKTVFPEIIEKGLTPQKLFEELKELYHDGDKRDLCLEGCQQLSSILQEEVASKNAAFAVGDLLK